MKLEKKRTIYLNHRLGKIFLTMTARAILIRKQINRFDYIKILSVYQRLKIKLQKKYICTSEFKKG